jgi:hypothetical protein
VSDAQRLGHAFIDGAAAKAFPELPSSFQLPSLAFL